MNRHTVPGERRCRMDQRSLAKWHLGHLLAKGVQRHHPSVARIHDHHGPIVADIQRPNVLQLA